MVAQSRYLEPELSAALQKSIGNNGAAWAKILGSVFASFPSRPLRLGADLPWPPFKGFPLAQLALSRLPAAKAETMVRQSVMDDLPGLASEPHHQLFAYNSNSALSGAISYLLRYRNDAAFGKRVKIALAKDSPGSSALAGRLIAEGQKNGLAEALNRALKVIGRPETDGSEVFSAIQLVLSYGTDDQRFQYTRVMTEMKSMNPDYAAFLQRQLSQSPLTHSE